MSSGGQKTQTKTKFPKWLRPYIKSSASRAENLYQQMSAASPPGLNPYTVQGLESQAARAGGGDTVARGAAEEALKILRGDYLDVTKDPNYTRSIDAALGMAADRFAGSGRVGSGAYSGALSDAAAGTAAAMYDRERQRQLGTLGLVPQLSLADYGNEMALRDVGGAYEDEAYRQFIWPYEPLDRFTNVIYGNPASLHPGSTSTTQRQFDWANALVGTGLTAMKVFGPKA